MAKYVWGNPEITEITPPDKARVGAFPYGGGVPVESGEVFSVENAFRTIHTYYSVLLVPVPVLHTCSVPESTRRAGSSSRCVTGAAGGASARHAGGAPPPTYLKAAEMEPRAIDDEPRGGMASKEKNRQVQI